MRGGWAAASNSLGDYYAGHSPTMECLGVHCHADMNRSLPAIDLLVPSPFLWCVALLAGCASAPVEKGPRLQRENVQAVNFSGSWEMDYSLSDSTQDKLDVMARDLNRQAQRRAQSEGRRRPAGAEMVMRQIAAQGPTAVPPS